MKNTLINSLVIVCLLSSFVFAVVTIDCGNNVCDREEVSVSVGEETTFNVFGNDYTFIVDRDRDDLIHVSGGGNQDDSVELYFVEGDVPFNHKFDPYVDFPNHEGPIVDVSIVIDEEQWCEIDCVGQSGIYAVPIHKGWNLVHGSSTFASENQNSFDQLTGSDVLASYAYLAPFGKYFDTSISAPFTEQEQQMLMSEYDEDFLRYAFEDTAFWIYSKRDTTYYINFGWEAEDSNDVEYLSQRNLFDGWNMVTIAPSFSGRSLGEIKGTCEFESAYKWVGEWVGGTYEEMADENFGESDVGLGIVFKTKGDCHLGLGLSSDDTPPPVPELP